MLRDVVLKKIKPTKWEEKIANDFIRDMVRVAKTISGYDAVVVGSIGKFTWLHGDHDVDLFMLFPDVERQELEDKGLAFGKKLANEMKGKFVIKYAEHPYVHAKINGFSVDIVPCYHIKKNEKIKSAVDRSPLHLEYVLERLDPDLRDDVRLLKQFCKGIAVYGSDAKRLGFAGYICELLIIRYGSFENVLNAASAWKPGKVIDIEGIGTAKFSDQPLIIIDPVDSKRNVAANLSCENFMKFVEKAREYMKKPSKDYFFPKKMSPLSAREIKILKNRETRFIAITMKKPDVIDDTLYPQLRRAMARLETLFRHNEFIIIRNFEYAEKEMALIFETEVWKLPVIKKMVGPPISSEKHSKEFLSKYKKASVEGDRWVAEKDRDYKTAHQLLKSFIGKKAKELVAAGIPDNIAKEFVKAKILESDDFWKFVRKNKNISIFLKAKYF
ncbi:MAG: CCA tRNA nucleotidyltransferase [Candidatus Aenigmatarchaeota archaeon]